MNTNDDSDRFFGILKKCGPSSIDPIACSTAAAAFNDESECYLKFIPRNLSNSTSSKYKYATLKDFRSPECDEIARKLLEKFPFFLATMEQISHESSSSSSSSRDRCTETMCGGTATATTARCNSEENWQPGLDTKCAFHLPSSSSAPISHQSLGDDVAQQHHANSMALTDLREDLALMKLNDELKRRGSRDLVTTDDSTEFDQSNAPKPYRSKSLKSGVKSSTKSKSVRFADSLGLELVSIRQIENADQPPIVPAAVLAALHADMDKKAKLFERPLLQLNFTCPNLLPDFLDRLRAQSVLLESVVIIGDTSLSGQIRVMNLAFSKRVYVRYTWNRWNNFSELEANYIPGSSDSFSDRFGFTLLSPWDIQRGRHLEFAIRYVTNDREYWDSNVSSNYTVSCVTKGSLPSSDSLHIFY